MCPVHRLGGLGGVPRAQARGSRGVPRAQEHVSRTVLDHSNIVVL